MTRLLPLLCVLACACRSPAGKDSGAVDDGQPHVFIVSPDAGATVGGCLALEVEVDNFTVVNPVDEPAVVAGHGHFHAVFGPRYFVCESLTCDIALTDDVAGDITVVVQLVGNDHVPVQDADGADVTDERTFAYTGEPCLGA